MNCQRCNKNLIDYHYQELDPATYEDMAEHLTGCGDCALEYCRLDGEFRGVIDNTRVRPSDDLHRKLRNRVAAEFAPSWKNKLAQLFTIPIPVYQTALLLVVSLTLAFFLSSERRAPHSVSGDLTAQHASTHAPAVILENYDANRLIIVDNDQL